MSKNNGVFQLENGYWGYRFRIYKDGNFGDRIEVIDSPKVREELKQYIKSVLDNYEK